MAIPSKTVASGSILLRSVKQLAFPPPPCDMNGIIFFPEKLCSERNVVTGGAIVLYQFGEPMKIVSNFSRSSTFYLSGGL